MPSPFLGMDPYLEQPTLWPDLHQRLITYSADALQTQVRPRYHARIGERVYLVALGRTFYPGITLIGRPVREPDPDVVLDPPAVFNLCYENGGYANLIDYSPPPAVSLSAEEESWLTEWLA